MLVHDMTVEDITEKVKSVVHSVQSNECLPLQTFGAGPDDGLNMRADEELENEKRGVTPRRKTSFDRSKYSP